MEKYILPDIPNYHQLDVYLKHGGFESVKKAFQQAQMQASSLSPEGGINNISIENSLAISSFVLFGKPWKKL